MSIRAVRGRDVLKPEAFKLRKKNFSFLQISKELNIPKSTLSGWFKNELWSKEISKELSQANSQRAADRLCLMADANKKKFENLRASYRREAEKEFPRLFRNKLFFASLMIYAGEGDLKVKNSLVRVANTDWRMLKTFKKFLNEICNLPDEKIHGAIVLYPDLDEAKCKKFWSGKIGIRPNQFHKSQFIKGKHTTNRLKNGIAYVIVCSRELKEKILVWINLCYKSF